MRYHFLCVNIDVKTIGKHQDRQFPERKTHMVNKFENLRLKHIKWK